MRFFRILILATAYLILLLILIYFEYFQLVQPIEDGLNCIAFHFNHPEATYNIASAVIWGTDVLSIGSASLHMGNIS